MSICQRTRVIFKNIPIKSLLSLPNNTVLKMLQSKDDRITKLKEDWRQAILLTGHVAEGDTIYVIVKGKK